MFAEDSTTAAVLRAIQAFWDEEGFGPCIRDIMDATGVSSTSVVSYHIGKLERAGALRRTAGVARSYVVVDGRGAGDMIYDDKMDTECIPICDAINSIRDLYTVGSCCGHGERPFKVYFKCISLRYLPVLLYHCDPCHVGFRWICNVGTDCGMSPVTFHIESESVGEAAYKEANIIAEKIMAWLKDEQGAA